MSELLHLQYLHDFSILAAVQRVELKGFKVVWRNGSISGSSLQFIFALAKWLTVPGFSTLEGVSQKWL